MVFTWYCRSKTTFSVYSYYILLNPQFYTAFGKRNERQVVRQYPQSLLLCFALHFWSISMESSMCEICEISQRNTTASSVFYATKTITILNTKNFDGQKKHVPAYYRELLWVYSWFLDMAYNLRQKKKNPKLIIWTEGLVSSLQEKTGCPCIFGRTESLHKGRINSNGCTTIYDQGIRGISWPETGVCKIEWRKLH